MKTIKKIIILCVVFLILLLIILFILIKSINQENETPEYNSGPQGVVGEYTLNVESKVQNVMNRKKFYTVQSCVNKFYTYYMSIFDESMSQYFKSKQEEQEQKQLKAEAIYGMLDKEYLSSNSMTKDNILTKLEKIDMSITTITSMLVSEQNQNMEVYIVNGMLRNTSNNSVTPFQLIVKLDDENKTFSIIPQNYSNSKYNNVKVGDNLDIKVENSIEQNEHNIYTFVIVNEETYIKDMFNNYKEILLYNSDLAYKVLDEEYRQKRFGSLEKFKRNLVSYNEKYAKIEVEQYKQIIKDGYTQYIFIDKNGNYYLFKETSLMNYTVMLDTYTVDVPEIVEQYNSYTDEKKVLYNVLNVFTAINNGDYRYMYGKLDEEFKLNYFKTEADFEKYVNTKWFKNNKISYGECQKDNDVYVYEVQISDETGASKNVIKTRIVMKLKEGTDFVMSFGVE